MKVLEERKKQILQAIIDEYISTAEPVSSGALVNRHGLNCSSATIRNEMAELEKAGYLDKPHTSSGRIPSAQGYRFYVDELVKEDDISLEEIRYITSKLETRVNAIEDLTKIATSTLSEITHYTSVAIGPQNGFQNIEEVKFVLLGTRMLMAVILTDTGIIKETIIKFDEDITEEQVNTLNFIFNNKLKGKPLEAINKPLEEYIFSEMNYSLAVIKPVMEQFNKVVNEESKVYLEGANKSFELPEERNDEFLQLLEFTVKYFFVKGVVYNSVNYVKDAVFKTCVAIEAEKDYLEEYSKVSKEDIISFNQRIKNKQYGRYLRGLVLLAAYLNPKQNMDDFDDFLIETHHIEHILPKKWNNYDGWNEETWSNDLNSLGNLIPLEYRLNINAKNEFFNRKKDYYRDSTVQDALDLLSLNDWNPSILHQIQDEKEKRLESFFTFNK